MADVNPHVRRAIDAFNDHDADQLMAEMAADATFTDPLAENVSGAELRAYTDEIFEAFPDIRLEEKRIIASDEGVVALECDYVGTHEGTIEGIPPTGNSVQVPSMTVIDIADDGITAWRDYWDQRTFSEQLGLTFPEIVPLVPKIAVAKIREVI